MQENIKTSRVEYGKEIANRYHSFYKKCDDAVKAGSVLNNKIYEVFAQLEAKMAICKAMCTEASDISTIAIFEKSLIRFVK
jgi:hypothetical protein